jgi:xanthine dehydrogenase YagT iron-sulfur-binding subunit
VLNTFFGRTERQAPPFDRAGKIYDSFDNRGRRLPSKNILVRNQHLRNSIQPKSNIARRNIMAELKSVIDLAETDSTSSTVEIGLQINGATHTLRIEPRVSLLDALRENLSLTGTKKGCNQGACGACTVLVDGERILSCLALAAQYERRAITTIEGLAGWTKDGALHPVQAAFIEQDGFQCGYCTPGQICSAIGMIREFQDGSASAVTKDVSASVVELSDEEIKERMSGNLCRCGAYVGICDAIREALDSEVVQ